MNVAVLGMGNMGRALATRLLQGGQRVAVWNRTPGRTAEVVSAGARDATSVDDAVHGADVVITILANDDAVRDVAFGPLRASAADQSVYIDCSTVSPTLSAELADAYPGRFVAMPVVGNPAAVRSGRSVLLAGGDAGLIERLHPVLAALSPTVRCYTSAPLAAAAKLATNLLLLSGIVALAESFAVGRSGGLTDDQLRDLLADSPVVAPGLHNRFEAVLSGDQDPWWTTTLGAKDAGLALDLARRAGLELPATAAVRRCYETAAGSGLGDADIAAVGRLYPRPA